MHGLACGTRSLGRPVMSWWWRMRACVRKLDLSVAFLYLFLTNFLPEMNTQALLHAINCRACCGLWRDRAWRNVHALLSWSLSGEFRSLGGQILVADDDDASCHACAVSIYYLYMMMRHPINKIALTGLHSFLVNEYSSSRTRMTEAAMRKRAYVQNIY